MSLVCLTSQWHLHCWNPLPGICDPTHTVQGPPTSSAVSLQCPSWPPFPLSIALLCYLCLTLCAPSSSSGVNNPGLAWALGICGCLNWLFYSPSPLKLAPSSVFATSANGNLVITCCPCQKTGRHLTPGPLGLTAKAIHLLPFRHCELGICKTLASSGSKFLFYWVSWSIRTISFPQGFILKILKFTEKLKEEFNGHVCLFVC